MCVAAVASTLAGEGGEGEHGDWPDEPTVDRDPDETPTPAVAFGAPLDVLLVEDDHDVNEAMVDEISSCKGHPVTVRRAYNGQEALELMHDRTPDVIFLDVRMPVMDGLQFRRAMWARQEWNDVMVAVVTAQMATKTEQSVLVADWYIPKPPTHEQICEVLGKVREYQHNRSMRRLARDEANLARMEAIVNELRASIERRRGKL